MTGETQKMRASQMSLHSSDNGGFRIGGAQVLAKPSVRPTLASIGDLRSIGDQITAVASTVDDETVMINPGASLRQPTRRSGSGLCSGLYGATWRRHANFTGLR